MENALVPAAAPLLGEPTTLSGRFASLPLKPLLTLAAGAIALATIAVALVVQANKPDS
mgnify:CR=1 FL=1